jgi:hypothetical protein
MSYHRRFLDNPVSNFRNKKTVISPKFSLVDEGFCLFSFYDASLGENWCSRRTDVFVLWMSPFMLWYVIWHVSVFTVNWLSPCQQNMKTWYRWLLRLPMPVSSAFLFVLVFPSILFSFFQVDVREKFHPPKSFLLLLLLYFPTRT